MLASPSLRSPAWTTYTIFFLLLLGLLARLLQYLGDVSFWMDELFSIVNIESMGLVELLTRQPEYNQVAPPGYYFIQKSLLLITGTSGEMILRLYPLVCSGIALYLIYRIALRFLQGIGLIACMALVVSALGSWFYGTSAKPYAGEQMFMAFFILTLLILNEGTLKPWQYLLLGITGFIGTSSTFLGTAFMVGAVPFLLWNSVHKKSWLIFLAAAWVTGALLTIWYTQTVIDPQVQADMSVTHAEGFPSGGIFTFPLWVWNTLIDSYHYFMFVTLPVPGFMDILHGLLIVLALTGMVIVFKKNRYNGLLLLLPFLMLIGLATLHLLPLNNRFGNAIFWIIPILAMVSLMRAKELIRYAWTADLMAILLALPSMLALIGGLLTLPVHFDPTEELLARVNKDLEEGQLVLVHPRGYLQMDYYGPKAGINDYYIMRNEVTIAQVENTLDEIRPKEAWLIVTNVLDYPSSVSVEEYDRLFNNRAEVLTEHRLTDDTYAILYRFH